MKQAIVEITDTDVVEAFGEISVTYADDIPWEVVIDTIIANITIEEINDDYNGDEFE
jgi:hypothetical protein